MKCILLFFIHILCSIVQSRTAESCSRSDSKHVREFITEQLLPLYDAINAQVPSQCNLHLHRDLFHHQELSIYQEQHSSHWGCEFCGKHFYEYKYILMHMDNRHEDKLNKDNGFLCLSEMCNIFRCEVLSRKNEGEFWERALCKPSEMKKLSQLCFDIVVDCVPDHLDELYRDKFLGDLNNKLCSYLSCSKYWKVPIKEDSKPLSIAFYIIAAMFVSLGFLIYYYLVYAHFYTDDSPLSVFAAEENVHLHRHNSIPGIARHRKPARSYLS